MKKISIISIVSVVLFVFIGTGVAFANGKKQTETFKNTYVSDYIQELENYEKAYNELVAKLELAYDKNDAETYSETKKELKNLEYPRLSKEKTNQIIETLASDDYESANWLYQNSRWYHPVIKMVSNSDNFSYSNTVTTNPGSNVKLPTIKSPEHTMKFQGWGEDQTEVRYVGGETIKMPTSDLTLYAIFAPNTDLIAGKHLSINNCVVSQTENLTLNRSQQCDFTFDIENIGTENIRNFNISVESDDPLLVILADNISCSFLPVAETLSVRFKVISKATSGTTMDAVIRVTDFENTVWSQPVSFTVN